MSRFDDGTRGNTEPVMPALVAGIHVFFRGSKVVDGRDKPGHDA
jgi:hypothetical protein